MHRHFEIFLFRKFFKKTIFIFLDIKYNNDSKYNKSLLQLMSFINIINKCYLIFKKKH